MPPLPIPEKMLQIWKEVNGEWGGRLSPIPSGWLGIQMIVEPSEKRIREMCEEIVEGIARRELGRNGAILYIEELKKAFSENGSCAKCP